MATLHKMATTCKFRDFLDEALCDRFVSGICSSSIQKRFLTEEDLSSAAALQLTQSMESAQNSSTKLQGSETPSVNYGSVPSQRGRELHPSSSGGSCSKSSKLCYRCGGKRLPTNCRFIEVTCNKCHKKGHIARACMSGSRQIPPGGKAPNKQQSNQRPQHRAHAIQGTDPDTPDTDSEESDSLPLLRVGGKARQPIVVKLTVDGKDIPMEVDTGAAVSLISLATKKQLFPQKKLLDSTLVLTTYTGEQMAVVGRMHVKVNYGETTKLLFLYVVEGQGPSLMGREWLNEIRINWQELNLAAETSNNVAPMNNEVGKLLQKYGNIFKEGLGVMNTFEARLQVKEGAKPKFCKARPVPFALKAAIDRELDCLENEGILEPVTYSEWAAPVVPVPKTEGQIRFCGDYKVTINPVLEVDQYPLPKPNNIFATLSTEKVFSKIDLTHAYQQMKLTEDSRNYVTINTHCGLFRYTRLPFGVASAPSIFQKVMDTVLQGLPNTICYLDDILVSGATKEEHFHNLEMVLQLFMLRRQNVLSMCDAVEYLGHHIDADGLHTLSSKVKAIQDAPQPQNIQELR